MGHDEPIHPPEARYLGDSVYIEFDGYSVILTTNNGYPDDPRNRIALEPEVLHNFKQWEKQLSTFIREYIRRQDREPGVVDVTPMPPSKEENDVTNEG
jgi:hypothetical protein